MVKGKLVCVCSACDFGGGGGLLAMGHMVCAREAGGLS